jgi:hypothetical protein
VFHGEPEVLDFGSPHGLCSSHGQCSAHFRTDQTEPQESSRSEKNNALSHNGVMGNMSLDPAAGPFF